MFLSVNNLRFASVGMLAMLLVALGCTPGVTRRYAQAPVPRSSPQTGLQHRAVAGHASCTGCPHCGRAVSQVAYRPVNPYAVAQTTNVPAKKPQNTAARPMSLAEMFARMTPRPIYPQPHTHARRSPYQTLYHHSGNAPIASNGRQFRQNVQPGNMPNTPQHPNSEVLQAAFQAEQVASSPNTNKYYAPVGSDAPTIRQAAHVAAAENRSAIRQAALTEEEMADAPSLGTPSMRSASPGTPIGAELNRPWELGEYDTDGARIVTGPAPADARNRYDAPPQLAAAPRGNPFVEDVSGNRSAAPATSRMSRATRQQPPQKKLANFMPDLNFGKKVVSEFRPSNDRVWGANYQLLPTAEIVGDQVTIRNIRYSIYRSAKDYTTRYYDQTFDLSQIRTVDLITAPFYGVPSIAHVEASFGFADGRHIAVSIEARYEEGESYDALGAVTNQFELIYVVADERDLIRLYTQINKNDVFLYRLKMTPEEVHKVFEGVLARANKLADKPEFYHAVTNNCATNLIAHINAARPGTIPRDFRARLPGRIDKLLFDRGLLQNATADFKTTRENARINWLAEKFGDIEYFSAGIRQHLY